MLHRNLVLVSLLSNMQHCEVIIRINNEVTQYICSQLRCIRVHMLAKLMAEIYTKPRKPVEVFNTHEIGEMKRCLPLFDVSVLSRERRKAGR